MTVDLWWPCHGVLEDWIKVSLNWLDGRRNSYMTSARERGVKLGRAEEGKRSEPPL